MFSRVDSEEGFLALELLDMKFVEVSEVGGVGQPPVALKKNSGERHDSHCGVCCVSTHFLGFAWLVRLSGVGMLSGHYSNYEEVIWMMASNHR